MVLEHTTFQQVYTARELAKVLRMGYKTFLAAVRAGDLPAPKKYGPRIQRWTHDSVASLLS